MNEHYSIKYYYIARIFFRWVFLCQILFAGVTGKVTGKVIDDNTGEALLGANIQIVGTYLGTSSDESGYFVILNIPPGAQTLRASMIGYSDVTVTGVRVEIDLTTEVDIQMKPEVIEGELIEVIAERKLVRLDVAASQKSISSNDIDQLPVSSVSDVISLQAGVSGFSVRGGSYNETMYAIDGIVMNDARTSEPTTGIPLSAIQDISVQTGGFGAEYRNVRSGVVNVVTKEGNPDRYSGTISFRNSPPTQKHFGISPYDKNSFWNRPYFDDDVCWTGTNNGNWDEYTQRQYPSFDGWNSVSQQTLADNDPINDLAPSGAQKLFTWENRKNGAISLPDYNIDAGFGGPVPLLSKKLGNLRFFASFRSEHDAYLYQVSRPGLNKVSSLIKLTSDLSKSMKLSFSYIAGELQATTLSRGGGASYMNDVWDLASQVNMRGFTMPWRLFTDIYWSSSTVNNATTAMKLTHQLSHRSFYEVLVKFDEKNYHTWHGARRDTTRDNEILDGYYVDDSPEGFWGSPYFSVDGRLAFGGAVSTARDTSIIRSFTIKSDLTSQYNRTNQIKAGMEFVYNDLDLQFGSRNEFLPEGNYWTSMTQQPYRLSMYAQDKLEHQGFVAIAGLNLDFVDPNGEWYVLDVYDDQFYSSNYSPEQDDQYQKEKLKGDMSLSPRLAISHPITEVSKLYFNYGHYQQMPIAQDLYRIRRGNNNEVINMGDPVLPMAKTISYELGYDHAFKDMYLVHLSAYYKDILDQQDYTEYISANSKVIYYQLTSNSYEDIRGFELELAKIRGDWITGQVNYEYRVNTSGYFGVKKYFENPSEQRYYILKNPKQSKPRPTPRIKSVIDLHTPLQFGPKIAGQYLLGDWHINVLSYWRTGSWFTYNPNNVPGIEYNVQYKDNYSFDLKLAKSIQVGRVRLKLYADVYNVFNIKNFSGYGFEDGYDYNYYMQSLHMSDDVAGDLGYSNLTGEDKPGDVRDEGVDFVPMEWVANVESISTPSERPIYFDGATSAYMQWSQDNGWTEVNNNYYDEVINTKAYIDMPNLSHFVFLNPMDIFFGISLSYDF